MDYPEDLIRDFKFFAEHIEGTPYQDKLFELMQGYVSVWEKNLQEAAKKELQNRKVIPFRRNNIV